MISKIKKSIVEATWPFLRRPCRSRLRIHALGDMRYLRPTNVKKEAIRAAKSLLICRIPEETSGLLAFLSHYRQIGVDHLLLIDGSGSEEVADLLATQDDCSVWQPLLGFKDSEYDKRYFHALLHTHCIGKWTLCVDLGELFIYPYMETRCLQDLTGQLDDCNRNTLWAIQVEVYGSGPVLETDHSSDELRYFDPAGYYQTYGDLGQLEVRGGPRMRLARAFSLAEIPDPDRLTPQRLSRLRRDFPDVFAAIVGSGRLDQIPTLHKIPLLKPDEAVFYQFRNRNVTDQKLNWPHKWHPCPTGVLLAPKYNKTYAENLLLGKGIESRIPGWSYFESMLSQQLRIDPRFSFKEDWSERYISSESLIDCGLMSDGAAFRPASRMANGI